MDDVVPESVIVNPNPWSKEWENINEPVVVKLVVVVVELLIPSIVNG